jgi:hypothetical protein
MRSGESVSGTSRHFAATQHFGRFWGEADINRQTKPAASVENDPKRTSLAEVRLGDVGIAARCQCLGLVAG